MSERARILIVRLSSIGDVVHSLPILPALRRIHPDAFVGWAVEDKAAGLLEGHPLLDRLHVLPVKAWKAGGLRARTLVELARFLGEIRNERYAIAIDLQELFRSGAISFLSGAPRRIAHRGARELAGLFANDLLPFHDLFDPGKPIVERYLEPALHLGADEREAEFVLPPTKDETRLYVDDLLRGVDRSRKNVVFSPATTWASKHWREEYWSELLDLVADRCNVIFSGTAGDLDLVGRITAAARTGSFLVVAGRTDLPQLVELLRRADVVVAPDSGPAHVASAAGRPAVVCLFGPTSPRRNGPLGARHVSLSARLDCQPCVKRACPRRDHPMECAARLTPGEVFRLLEVHLGPDAPA